MTCVLLTLCEATKPATFDRLRGCMSQKTTILSEKAERTSEILKFETFRLM
jgi:hypothetical protein